MLLAYLAEAIRAGRNRQYHPSGLGKDRRLPCPVMENAQ